MPVFCFNFVKSSIRKIYTRFWQLIYSKNLMEKVKNEHIQVKYQKKSRVIEKVISYHYQCYINRESTRVML